MRVTRFPLLTIRETPADAEVISHQLMLRAGLIRRLSSGLYTWLPLGLRVLQRVERIVREEMNRAGALEILMPAVQPAELWQESKRWEKYGLELLRIKDRHERDFCFGPTHEEVITDLCRREIRSYKQLPVNYYQIQTKFRDEIRPRFGVMRAREFLMKDAYSFHLNPECLSREYELMHHTYCRIFTRTGLDFKAVEADTGAIGGNLSHEFMVLAESGEDAIAVCEQSGYAANVELAPTPSEQKPRPAAQEEMTKVATPQQRTIAEVSEYLGIPSSRSIKILIVEGVEGDLVALLLRGDHELNKIKAEKLSAVANPLTFANAARVDHELNCPFGSLGPVGLEGIQLIADHSAMQVTDFVCGANQEGYHLRGVNWGRDLPEPESADLRNVEESDPSPDGQGSLTIRRGIEVGHIFQLGKTYSEAMEATVRDEEGYESTVTMGCYGIGVSRVVAAAIEQNHDERGICWPEPIAPFQVALVAIKAEQQEVAEAAETLYGELSAAGLDVLYDDRDARPGVKFADIDLIGIPHRVVVSPKAIAQDHIEYKRRNDDESTTVPRDDIVTWLKTHTN